MRLGGQRSGGRRPRQVVLIDAGEAVIAVADRGEQVHGEFERGQSRFQPQLFRGDLIDRGAEFVIRTLGHLRLCRAQEARVGGGVIAGRVSGLVLDIAQHREAVQVGHQRTQSGGEFGQCARLSRRPAREVTAHRDVDEAQALHGRGQPQERPSKPGSSRPAGAATTPRPCPAETCASAAPSS